MIGTMIRHSTSLAIAQPTQNALDQMIWPLISPPGFSISVPAIDHFHPCRHASAAVHFPAECRSRP